ncbi:glutamate 5-kinase [uncultured Ruminococcus sp.]|uniref:glutamate 5-kinase n=1 Tax=uncultured Ruminococcus sp. TaxID=165186 RepID=UPI00292DB016|nr:glutamate 5-kinase [uncultured Ruminococcus sp.]
MRIVIKVGTSTLAHPTGLLNIKRVEQMCKVISDLKNAGHEIVLVSSGAIGMGLGKIGITKRPGDISTLQAAAAIGQCELMYTYDKLFSEYNHTVAQILMTGAFVAIEDYGKNLNNTLFRLLELGVIPIVNENDTVTTDEIVIGDNDTLGAIIAERVRADLLVILSDIDGLYTANPAKDPTAERIEIIEEITEEIEALAGDAGSKLGTGGMVTKLKAARIATESGVNMVIANGKDPSILYDIIDGKGTCTRFVAKR